MADKKISALDAIVTIDDADVLPIVDISEDITKKIQVSNFPISTATQTALDGKIAKSTGTTYDVTALSAVTQAEYDALTPSATTLYFII